MIKPSKNIIAVLIVCLTVIGVTVFISTHRKSPSAFMVVAEPKANFEISQEIGQYNTTDTDGDGLLDWEEILYGSDIRMTDTDGDGTNDKEEVVNGRNPNKKGPNDLLSAQEQQKIASNSLAEGFTSGSLTDELSKELFESYILSKQGGNTSANQTQLVTNLAQQASQSINRNYFYSTRDIKGVAVSAASLSTYGNEFARIYTEKMTDIASLSTDSSSMNSLIAIYKALASDLSKIEVPETLVISHLKLINNFYSLHEASILMNNHLKDPVKALFAIKIIKEVEVENPKLFTTIATEFKKSGIIFSSNEAGVWWNKF